MQAVAPLPDWYMPAAHDAQALVPALAAYLPGLHAVAAVARAKHALPAGQSAHAVLPLADWYLPASHAEHMLWPSLAVIVPASHAVADVLPVAQAEPAGHVLQSLGEADLKQIVAKAQAINALPAIEDAALERLIAYADGDARRLLNTLETLAVAARAEKLEAIGDEWLLRVLGERMRRYDKGGEQFYDTISALHKSVRGCDPDAALYWFVRMLDGGADPRYMARRLVRMASEDIGLADPRALRLALDAAEVYERLGTPEGELALTQCVVYLAMAPKSNAVYTAYNAVRALVKKDSTRPVPMHLRNAPTKLMKELDYGKGYRYAHDEEGGFAAGEQYLPDGLQGQVFYEPVERGLEIRIGEKLRELRRRNAEHGD